MICAKCREGKHEECEYPQSDPCQHLPHEQAEARKLPTLDESTIRQISLRTGDPRDC